MDMGSKFFLNNENNGKGRKDGRWDKSQNYAEQITWLLLVVILTPLHQEQVNIGRGVACGG